jgi:hypothetical protein
VIYGDSAGSIDARRKCHRYGYNVCGNDDDDQRHFPDEHNADKSSGTRGVGSLVQLPSAGAPGCARADDFWVDVGFSRIQHQSAGFA